MANNILVHSVFASSGGNPESYSYVLQTDSGNESLLQFVNEEEVILTATAGDIRTGMTAITDDGVITGTFAGVDTSDANAVAEDILLGKTAYVNGEKITGTYEKIVLPELTNPATEAQIVTGYEAINGNGEIMTGTAEIIDTTDATATAGDIRSGVTAYVNGVKVTGTWTPALVTKSETKTLTQKNPGSGKTLTLTFTFSGNISGTPTFTATQPLTGLTWGGTFGTPTVSGNTCTVVFTSDAGGSDPVDFKATASVTVIE